MIIKKKKKRKNIAPLAERQRSSQMRRKLLAHMLQGLESRAFYDFVASHRGVYALEHDAFISLSKLSDDDWQPPYLHIVLKEMTQV